jgi:hypothetical protein
MIAVLTLAFAANPGQIPVHGAFSDGAGTPLDGTHPVLFRLKSGSEASPVERWSGGGPVAFTSGQFGTALTLDLDLFDDPSITWLTLEVGGVESAPVAIGTAPRAAHALWADTAHDAESLGGMPAADWLHGGELGDGLSLDGANARVNAGNGLQVTSDVLSVKPGAGLAFQGSALAVDASTDGFTFPGGQLSLNTGDGLRFSSGALGLNTSANGFLFSGGQLSLNTGDGLRFSSGALGLNTSANGFLFSGGQLGLNTGNGLTFSSGALSVNAGAGLTFSGPALTVNNAALTPTWSNVQSRPAWVSDATEGAFEARVEGYLANGDLSVGGGVKLAAQVAGCSNTTRGALSYHSSELWVCKPSGWVQVTGYVPPMITVYPSTSKNGSEVYGNSSWGTGTDRYTTVLHNSTLFDTVPGAYTLNGDGSVTINQTGWFNVELRALVHRNQAMWTHTLLQISTDGGGSWAHGGWLNHSPSGHTTISWHDHQGNRWMQINAGTRLRQQVYASVNTEWIYHSGSTNTDYTYMRIERLDRP